MDVDWRTFGVDDLWRGRGNVCPNSRRIVVIHKLCTKGVYKPQLGLWGKSELTETVGEFRYLVVDATAFAHQVFDLAVRVHDRCMVAATELLADLR